ncbi:MAG TPA: R3H domain-containing nucleic acid-binding protein [Candidatus Polarisedimenticolia bacterium]|nr:R3H domain-containing nucleic acid-binding protein [Candidatus Polarisedimenticolia bacterium]
MGHERKGDRETEPEGEAPAADPADVVRLAERILHGLGLDIKATVRDGAEAIQLDLAGPDGEHLLSRKGEGLGALQYLLNRIIYRGRKGRKIQVDCGGFRKLREDEVVEIAVRSAEKVKAGGQECVLSPLNPYERRLVHIALAEMGGVETRSIGDGFLKQIAIVPAGQPKQDREPDGR